MEDKYVSTVIIFYRTSVRYIAIQKYNFIIILIIHDHCERVRIHSDFSTIGEEENDADRKDYKSQNRAYDILDYVIELIIGNQ